MADVEYTLESILNSVKAHLGIPIEVTDFDATLIIDINAAFSILTQLGVGPKAGFMITDSSETYDDFIGNQISQSMVKQYLYAKTRMSFDPPTAGSLMDALQNQISELEFRLQCAWDPTTTFK